jgi:hypothetical protein
MALLARGPEHGVFRHGMERRGRRNWSNARQQFVD